MERTTVYVDGFNLYYGALKGTSYKWLDLSALFKTIFPQNDIRAIKYYTALVVKRGNKPRQQKNQKLYWRALRTTPNLQIIEGKFYKTRVTVYSKKHHPPFVTGDKFEEKRSDVSLGAQLVHDAHMGRFDKAILVTNDSDLYEPVRIVTKEIGLQVGFIHPNIQRKKQKQYLTHALAQFVDDPNENIRQIRVSTLARCQFSQSLKDARGTFHCPDEWRQ